MPQVIYNNIISKIASGITNTSTSITLIEGHTFPDPGSDYYLATLVNVNPATGKEDDWEIVRVTALLGNVLTVVRGQEGTLARSWAGFTPIEMRITAASLTLPDGNATLANKTLTSPVITSPDVDGGTLDNVTIGGITPAPATVTTFTSSGIDDNAVATALTLEATGELALTSTTASSSTSTGALVVPGGVGVGGTIYAFGGNSGQWNTAFGWGDHATQGYLTGNQTITLSGDVSGSGTTSIVVTVANDSHTHNMANLTGTVYAAGSGANITSLNASNISTGTINDARLPATITSSITGNAATANALTTGRTISLGGDATGSTTFDGSANVTITATVDMAGLSGTVYAAGSGANLTSLNASNISTGTINDARLPATITSSITGNAATATQLATARSIILGGDLSGSASFDGSANATITASVLNDSHTHDTRYLRSDASDTMSGNLTVDAGASTTLTVLSDDTGESVISLRGNSQGTGRLYVGQSTTYGGGIEYNGDNSPAYSGAGSDQIAFYRVDNGIVSWTARNGVTSNNWEFRGTVTAPTFSGALSGNATTASAWSASRTLTLGGDLTGSVAFNGSSNFTLTAQVVNDSHTHAFNNLTSKTGGTGTYTTTGTFQANIGQFNDVRTNNGQQLVLNAGESASVATGQTGEVVYLNAENGVEINSSPDNWTTAGWAGRRTATICNPSGNSVFPGDVSAVTFSGSGASLTSLNASNISSGTLNAARLPTTGPGAGTYGSTADATKIDTITLDAYGRVTAVATGATGDITNVSAGVGLSGGGSSGSVTLTLDMSELTDMTVDMVGTDEFIVLDGGLDRRKAANEIGLSIFNNDSGFQTSSGSVATATTATNCSRSVIAGNGLTGGGALTANRTLNVGAGNGISVAADTVAMSGSFTGNFTATGAVRGQNIRLGTLGNTVVDVTAGNLHLDSAEGNGVYLNFYGGNAGTLFGNGSAVVVASIDANGRFIGSNGARLGVASTHSWGGNWSGGTVVIGNSNSDTLGALAFSYNDTDGGIIGSIDPGVAWKNVSCYSNEFRFRQNGGTAGVTLTSNGCKYVGLSVGGGSNDIAFTWTSPNLSGHIDDSVSVTVGTASDYRIKDNQRPYEDALEHALALEPKKFEVEGVTHTGLIAHEVAEILPSLVSGEKDGQKEDGTPILQSVNYAVLAATAIGAIKAQQKIIQDLEARLTAAGL